MRQSKLSPKNWSQKVKDAAALISAVLVIAGALVGAGHWIVEKVNAATNARLDSLEKTLEASTQENRLAIMRLEIMNLIQNDSDNILEIEKYAREYFSQGGNRYLTGMISTWCAEHSIDCGTIILK